MEKLRRVCPECYGSGTVYEGKKIKCPVCKGSGKVMDKEHLNKIQKEYEKL